MRLETVYKHHKAPSFKYLTSALTSHLQRFPSIENGLNNVENTILKTANNNLSINKRQLIIKLLKEQEAYGYGALQYAFKINTLSKLFSSFNPIQLNKKGKAVLEHELNFYRIIINIGCPFIWIDGK